MSAQGDLIPALDLSALASATQEQFMQAIAGLAPLTNLGLVYVGTTSQIPDSVNNPRFIRYIWLDITDPSNAIFRRYNGNRSVPTNNLVDWTPVGVGTAAILTSMLLGRSTTGGVDIAKLKVNADYSASAGSIYYVLRVASNGKDVEAVSLDTALADGGGVGFNRISVTGLGAQKYLGITAGALGYRYLDPANDFSVSLANQIPASSFAPSTAKYLLRTNSAGTSAEWVANNTADLFDAGAIALTKLAVSGAVAFDIIRMNAGATSWEKATPSIAIFGGAAINAGIETASDISATLVTQAHGLGAVPKLVRVVWLCKTNDAGTGALAGDEINVSGVQTTAGNTPISVYCDATNIKISSRVGGFANFQLSIRAGGAGAAPTANANFKYKVYAWL